MYIKMGSTKTVNFLLFKYLQRRIPITPNSYQNGLINILFLDKKLHGSLSKMSAESPSASDTQEGVKRRTFIAKVNHIYFLLSLFSLFTKSFIIQTKFCYK